MELLEECVNQGCCKGTFRKCDVTVGIGQCSRGVRMELRCWAFILVLWATCFNSRSNQDNWCSQCHDIHGFLFWEALLMICHIPCYANLRILLLCEIEYCWSWIPLSLIRHHLHLNTTRIFHYYFSFLFQMGFKICWGVSYLPKHSFMNETVIWRNRIYSLYLKETRKEINTQK